jgi:predicted outer membrane repeat protein
MNEANNDASITEIHVTEGTYYPSGYKIDMNEDASFFIYRGGLKLYGGYPPHGVGRRNIKNHPTILSGELFSIGDQSVSSGNTNHVLVIAGLDSTADSVVVDGFRIHSGRADGSGTFAYNGQNIPRKSGGGIAAFGNANGSKLAIRNCIISGNYASDAGAGVYNGASQMLLANCLLSGNYADYGGAIINANNASLQIVNCTIAGNHDNHGGGGLRNSSSTATIRNSIIYGNSGGIGNDVNSVDAYYSLIQGKTEITNNNLNGNTTNPLFVNPVVAGTANIGGDYQLRTCSPALDKGSNAALPAGILHDLNGNRRLYNGSIVDLGSYEDQGTLAPEATGQSFCGATTIASLQAEGTGLKWYNVPSAGSVLASNTPLVTGTYYVSQAITGCESPRKAVEVIVNTVPAAPTGATQSFCPNSTVSSLVATGSNLRWYLSASGGTALSSSTVLRAGNYYVTQTINDCEGPRKTIAITILSLPAAPVASKQYFCGNSTVNSLTASGTNVKWYDAANGGSPLASTTPLKTGFYYATQTVTCESPRIAVEVEVSIVPVPLGFTSQVFCGETTIASLVATGENIKWYGTASGGSALASTTALVSGNYYVTQTVGCESARKTVGVTVTNLPPAPAAYAQNFCKGNTLSSLVASGTNLRWYSEASGGNPLAANTVLLTGTYYVSQSNGCEGARTGIVISEISKNRFYVDSSVVTSGDGQTWRSAFKTLTEAINLLSYCIDTIHVAKGTYYPAGTQNSANRDIAFTINGRDIILYGGYPSGGGNVRNVDVNPVILSGDIGIAKDNTDNSYHIMVLTNTMIPTKRMVIDGFTFRGGNASGLGNTDYYGNSFSRSDGAAIAAVIRSKTDVVLAHCKFENNSAEGDGGAVYTTDTDSLKISHCTFDKNQSNNGGAIYAFLSGIHIEHGSFTGNSAKTAGGAFYDYARKLNISNSSFLNNHTSGVNATGGGGIYSAVTGGERHNITESIFKGNYTNGSGGAVHCNEKLLIIGSTFTENLALSSSGGGGAIYSTSSIIVTGSIFKDNSAPQGGAMNLQIATGYILDGNEYTENIATKSGGAIFFTSGAGGKIQRCDFLQNKSTGLANDDGGGAIKLTSSAKLNLSHSSFSKNTSTKAGGALMYYYSGDAQIDTCNFTRNKANGESGGAIYSIIAKQLIVGSTFTKNTSTKDGGAVFIQFGGETTITRSVFSENMATLKGGATYSHITSFLFKGNTFTKNEAGTQGGAVYAFSGGAIRESAFSENMAGEAGGALYNENSSSTEMQNNSFRGNRAITAGGAIYNLFSPTKFTNLLLAGNTAELGGAVFINNSGSVFYQSTFSGNKANFGGAIYTAPNTNTGIVNCLLQDNSSGVYHGDRATTAITYSNVQGITTGVGNQDQNAMFVDAPAYTAAPFIQGDYRLQPCSPAINSGTIDFAVLNLPNIDILGQPRVQLGRVDMGAYEMNSFTDGKATLVPSGNAIASAYQLPDTTTSYASDCNNLLLAVTSSGNSPVQGTTSVKVWIGTTPGFVNRHYEIAPENNPQTATGKVTLYFTQSEFNAYNSLNTYKFPTGSSDQSGIANLRIQKRSGISSDNSGQPATYPGARMEINPADTDIVWNSAKSRWEVSFNVTGFSGFFAYAVNHAALPVTLVSFRATPQEQNVLLAWQTTAETNASHFDVQRSMDAKTFETITTIKAGGESIVLKNYGYMDRFSGNLPSLLYYRLKAVDIDDTYTYSRMVLVKGDWEASFLSVLLYPNPSHGAVTLDLAGFKDDVIIKVYNLAGQQMTLSVRYQNGKYQINTLGLPPGIYLVHVSNEHQKVITKLAVK